MTYKLLLNCELKLVEEIILYYDARSKKQKKINNSLLDKDFPAFYDRPRFITGFTSTRRFSQDRNRWLVSVTSAPIYVNIS